ncbi:hypothetical protein BDZ89DRAFT_1046273 [Hymenopellis radicata]|nr:hypothetical protein BDZ89DRAFT_1046273 [Hymenopellis radicata]
MITNESQADGYVAHPAPPQRDLNAAEMWYHLQTLGPAAEGLRESFLRTSSYWEPRDAADSDQESQPGLPAHIRQRDDHGPADQEDRNMQAENARARAHRTNYRADDPNVWHRSEILHYSNATSLEGTDSKSWPYLVDKCADLWAEERAAGNLVDAPQLCTQCDPNIVVVLKVKGKKPGPRRKPDTPKDSAHCWLKPGMTNGACLRCRLINRPCSLKSGWKRGNYHVRPFVHGNQPNAMEVDGEEEEGMELENDEYVDNDE